MRVFKIFLWLLSVCILLQIWIGGVTRLTESGLSITEWNLVSGVFPPMSVKEWNEVFALYRESPQYKDINAHMSLSEFKYIFFWEYLHRLWGRVSGLLVVGAVLVFYFKRPVLVPRYLLKRLLVILFGFFVVGSFGWIMVASGLKERPWVNAYYLAIHLSLAIVLFCYVLESLVLCYKEEGVSFGSLPFGRSPLMWFVSILFVQFFLGGMLAGMRAALFYPTFPDMNGEIIPAVLLKLSNWKLSNFVFYDSNIFMSALVQFMHRFCAFFVLFIALWLSVCVFRSMVTSKGWKTIFAILSILISSQVILGIFTLINSRIEVPIVLGSAHQMVGVMLVAWGGVIVFVNRHLVKRT